MRPASRILCGAGFHPAFRFSIGTRRRKPTLPFPLPIRAAARRALLLAGSFLAIAAALAAQCTDAPLTIPPATYTSGDHSYSGFPTAANPNPSAPTVSGNFTITGPATGTFSAPNCIHLGQNFTAHAAGTANMFTSWVNVGPEVVSLSPTGSTGTLGLFTFTVQEPNLSNLQSIYLLFNTSTSGTNACYIQYNPNSGVLSLFNDQTNSWPGFAWNTATTPNSAQNAQCAIYESYLGNVANVVTSGNQISVSVPVWFPPSSFTGQMTEYVNASDNQGWTTGLLPMGQWTVGTPSGFTPIRISAGGPYTDSLGQAWASDSTYAQNGGPWSTTAAITNTPDQKLYQTEHYYNGAPNTLNYQFLNVPNGNYEVTLKFAEIYDSGPGLRNMNIAIDGNTVLLGLDVWTAAGGPNIAYDRSFPVAVINGRLTIALTCLNNNNSAEVNAIQIVSTGGTGTYLTISPSSLPAGLVGTSYTQTLYATGGTAPYTWSLISGSLPPGLNLSGSTLSGTPTTTGSFSFTLQVTDHASHTNTQAYTVTISSSTTVTLTPNAAAVGPGGTQQFAAAVTGLSNTSVTWSVASGPGLINTTSGMYTASGATAGSAVSIRAKAQDGTTAAVGFNILNQGVGISNWQVPSVYLSTTAATVTWTTSTNANSQLAFGLSSAYSRYTTLDTTLTENHQEYLTGLTPNTPYHYQIRSSDQSGNSSATTDLSFATLAAPVAIPTSVSSCANQSTNSPVTCTIPPGTWILNPTINIKSYGITLTGAVTDRTQTRLVRDPNPSDAAAILPLITVSVADSNGTISMTQAGKPEVPIVPQGVIIQNLTVCGGGNTHTNTRAAAPDNGLPAAMSPPGSPCADQQVPETTASACGYADTKPDPKFPTDPVRPICTDISVESVAVDLTGSGYYPMSSSTPTLSNPFSYSYTGPFALELSNVDLEDSPGHALSLYATATNPSGKAVNDVSIQNSAINFSAITGLLYGYNHATYDSKFCDGYQSHAVMNVPYSFADDPALYAPRNILIKGNQFRYNNTGVSGGTMRWAGWLNNNFFANYISPQGGNFGGGTIDLELCSDNIEISGNTFTGPNASNIGAAATVGQPPTSIPSPFTGTPALEIYGRNMNVHNNTITGYPHDAIPADSLFQSTIAGNHVLQDNGWYLYQQVQAGLPGSYAGGVTLGTRASTRPPGNCDPSFRETNGVNVQGNDSNPIDVFNNGAPVQTGAATQGFGVHLNYYAEMSSNRLNGVTVGSNNFAGTNPLFFLPGQYSVDLDDLVALNLYTGVAAGNMPAPQTVPFALPVDVVSASSSASSSTPFLWPTPPRCPDISSSGPPLNPLPPGSMMGSSRAQFKFAVADAGGAANVAGIWGIFSVAGTDVEVNLVGPPSVDIPAGSGGPAITSGLPDNGICDFFYDPMGNIVYLGDGSGGYLSTSIVGPGGSDLTTSGGCIIHAGTSTSTKVLYPTMMFPALSYATIYVADVTLDVTLPASPQNKYHLYTKGENGQYYFDSCNNPGVSTGCPAWKYSGYWWNVQVVH